MFLSRNRNLLFSPLPVFPTCFHSTKYMQEALGVFSFHSVVVKEPIMLGPLVSPSSGQWSLGW